MAITPTKLADGRVRYIARIYSSSNKKSRQKRFDTWEEAHNQVRDWLDIEAREKAKKWPSNCAKEQHFFLYRRR